MPRKLYVLPVLNLRYISLISIDSLRSKFGVMPLVNSSTISPINPFSC